MNNDLIEGKAWGVEFPDSTHLTTVAVGPNDQGRVLVVIEGHSGCSTWSEGLLTLPRQYLTGKDKGGFVPKGVLDGEWAVNIGNDKKGRLLLRLYPAQHSPVPNVIFSIPGHVDVSLSGDGVHILLECEGRSRTGRHGNRWSLVAAPDGTEIVYLPYDGSPVYGRVTERGLEEIGTADAEVPASEW